MGEPSARVVFLIVGKSDVIRTYKVGPRTLPCGTPDFIGRGLEAEFRTFIWNWWSTRYDLRALFKEN